MLRARREELRLTLQEVALEVGISKGHLSGIESGRYRDIRLATAARLAKALKLDLQKLADVVLADAASR
ncbi:helix-turn-helix transcriptional regulator [Caballeronia sp. LjRoot31]|nr:helix-turn-helix transcriptional regulator [Caballeronia sp. SBC1]